jgi:dimethylamine/trimethylamine dehydrogenase
MPRDPNYYNILFQPVRIGPKVMPVRIDPKVMRNRCYQTPHRTGFGSDRPRTQAHFRAM